MFYSQSSLLAQSLTTHSAVRISTLDVASR